MGQEAKIPPFSSTHVGSVPHTDQMALCERLTSTLDIPAWPQLPHMSFRESMYVQTSAPLPGIVEDETKEKVFFNTADDLTPALEAFYERYLADDVTFFALRPAYAAGFFTMLDTLRQTPGSWAKGQVTGPVSFGLTVTDQDLRASLYNDLLADTIVKNAAMNARWQVRQLHELRPNVVMFVDEPYLAAFGSAYISLSREQVITMLDEVFEAIHQEGGLAGVHCCGNTDWSVLLATSVDILNLDAYSYVENLALYPAELSAFMARGGRIAWGIVPNNEAIDTVAPEQLARQLQDSMMLVSRRAAARNIHITTDQLAAASLLTPSCGLGSTSVEIAEKVLKTLVETRKHLR